MYKSLMLATLFLSAGAFAETELCAKLASESASVCSLEKTVKNKAIRNRNEGAGTLADVQEAHFELLDCQAKFQSDCFKASVRMKRDY
jgi:hypothetical protein